MKVTHTYQLDELNRRVDRIFARADRIVETLREKKSPLDYAQIEGDYQAVRKEINIYLGFLRADISQRYPTADLQRERAAENSLNRLTVDFELAEARIEVLNQFSPQNGSAQLMTGYHKALDDLKRLIEQSEGKSEGRR